jgi:hypothetical protein
MEIWSAFLLGFAGSLHCAGMCGPLALALPMAGRSGAGFLAGRLAYNAGRVVTYCLLGGVFGLLGKLLLLAGVQRWVSIALGVLLLVGLAASRRWERWLPVARLVNPLKARMAPLLRQPTFTALGVLGLLNGLLPCGLVYVAGAGAVATGHLATGVAYMAVFGLGTVPMMLAMSLSGKLLSAPLRHRLRSLVPISIALVAALLVLRGLGLGIPYLSPDLSTGHCAHCHPE